MYRYVLFDLDGTLTDPKEGICGSVQYALEKLNIYEPDPDKLECFIGPPLSDSFREFYGLDEAGIEEGIKRYRERYATTGIFENELYPGMRELLEALSKKGIHLAVASSKPKPFVDRILKHFQIDSYFDVVAGGDMDEKKVSKASVMREALSLLFHIPEERIAEYENIADDESDNEQTREQKEAAYKKMKRLLPIDDILMIGDRKYDVEGAARFFIDCVGVTYGYAERGELRKAGAEYITNSLDDIFEIITDEKPEQEGKNRNVFWKSYQILLPLVYDYALTYGVLFLCTLLLNLFIQGPLYQYAGWFAAHSSQTAVGTDAFSACICTLVFGALYKREKVRPISKVVERRIKENLRRYAGIIIGLGICLSLLLNLVFLLFPIVNTSEAYRETASIQYSVPIFAGLLIYGVIKPVEEELLFRGLIYGRMRRYFPSVLCIPVSALIFGAYHANLVQLLYGFAMGCLLAWLYEKLKSLTASVLFHSAANAAVYLVSMIPSFNRIIVHPLTIGFIVAAAILCSAVIWINSGKLFE